MDKFLSTFSVRLSKLQNRIALKENEEKASALLILFSLASWYEAFYDLDACYKNKRDAGMVLSTPTPLTTINEKGINDG